MWHNLLKHTRLLFFHLRTRIKTAPLPKLELITPLFTLDKKPRSESALKKLKQNFPWFICVAESLLLSLATPEKGWA